MSTPKTLPKPHLWTTKQAAAYAGVSATTLKLWSKAGVAPAPVRPGTSSRPHPKYVREEIEQWVAAGCPAAS